MKAIHKLILSICVVAAILIGAGVYVTFIEGTYKTPGGQKPLSEIDLTEDERSDIESKRDLIVLTSPEPLEEVSSPLTLTGEARGSWYFEADFPVRIEDANGTVLGEHYATAQDDWMTEDFVPFKSTLVFKTPTTERGEIILERSNPSGLAENDDALRIPVWFASVSEEDKRNVTLYYYNPELDQDEDGNILCSDEGLVAVERTIPITQTPIQDTINTLIRGEVTSSEEVDGVTTEFPLDGLELIGASLNDGVLTLQFDDPENATSGGSCRAGILWAQIARTAEQFDEVDEVQFEPEELFQP